MSPVLLTIAWRFLLLAFLAIGGANAVVPELHRLAVEVERWMTAEQFAALFAIASTAPGPNVLIVTLIGREAAGWPGALVATVALIAPTALLTYGVFSLWNRFRDAPWRRPVQDGLAAVMVGLIAASAWLLADAALTGWATGLVAAATALVTWRTKVNPLWSFAAGALVGIVALS